MVVSELRGEKIDIIPFNDEPARFVAKALSPARVREVLVDDEAKQATVIVPDDQLSLAIGREGQNAQAGGAADRLARSTSARRVDFAAEEPEHGYEEEEVGEGRCAAILPTAGAARTPRWREPATARSRRTPSWSALEEALGRELTGDEVHEAVTPKGFARISELADETGDPAATDGEGS